MSKKTDSDRFTKIISDTLINVRDLVNWGIDTGNTTTEKMRLTVAARRETAIKLIEGGMSQRRAAKVLGVTQTTIRRDVKQNVSKSETKSATSIARPGTSPATKARRAAVAAKASAKGVTAAPSAEKYRIVYADPPWNYGGHDQPDYQTSPQDYYPVTGLDDICAVPVKEWVEDDAVLFLWVPSPLLEKSLAVVHAWGFEYKQNFVWDKIKHNMGYYNSVRHEFLFICTRGSCLPDNKQLFDSVQSIERAAHSVKPLEFYDIIETLYTNGRRLEIYGRGKREGWDVYGHIAELEAASK